MGDASESSKYDNHTKPVLQLPKVQTDLTREKGYERLVVSRLREMVSISQEQWSFMPPQTIYSSFARSNREKRKSCFWHSWIWRGPMTSSFEPCFWKLFWRSVWQRLTTANHNHVPKLEGGKNSAQGNKNRDHHSGGTSLVGTERLLLFAKT